MFSQVR